MPYKMYEWDVLPERTERRKTSTIRSCPMISANGTCAVLVLEPFQNLRRNPVGNRIYSTAGADRQEAVGLTRSQLQVATPDTLMKGQGFQFEALLARTAGGLDPALCPCQADSNIAVHQHGQVGSDGLAGQGVKSIYRGAVDAASAVLVGNSGIGEPVAEDNRIGLKGRYDNFGHMLGAGRRIQQQFRQRHHTLVVGIQQDGADLVGYGAATRFAGQKCMVAGVCQALGQISDLGRLAAPFDTLECDKKPHDTPPDPVL